MLRTFLAALALGLPRPSGAAPRPPSLGEGSGTPAPTTQGAGRTARLALIEDSPYILSLRLAVPLEKLLAAESERAQLLSADQLACEAGPGVYRCPLPGPRTDAPPGPVPAEAGESESEVLLVSPPEPSFIRAFAAAAADPAFYRFPYSVRLSTRAAQISTIRGPDGRPVLEARASLGRPAVGIPHRTVAARYKILWEGRTLTVLLASRVMGGLGRLKTAVERERARGPLTGLSRGNVFGDSSSDLRGAALAEALENVGLEFSGVSGSELRNWESLQDYRRRRPGGITFLSANLVLSSGPGETLLPDRAIFESGGLRVGVTALTPPSAEKYLRGAGLGHVRVADPVQALEARIASLRREADVVVVLGDLAAADAARVAASVRGIDVLIAEEEPLLLYGPERPAAEARQPARPEFSAPLWRMRAWNASLGILEISKEGEPPEWTVRERNAALNEEVPEAPGWDRFDAAAYGVAEDNSPPLIPSARSLNLERRGFSMISSREFWSLAASVLAERTRSEAALLPVIPLAAQTVSDIKEGMVRRWLRIDDQAVVVGLKGGALRSLLGQARAQREREDRGLPHGGRTRFTAAGIDDGNRIHGQPIDPELYYRVACSRALLDGLEISPLGEPEPVPAGLEDEVIAGLTSLRAGNASDDEYRSWLKGAPLRRRGLWKVAFRDVGLNVSSTRVVRDDAFARVPNSRVQALDELLIGGVFKADAAYHFGELKWTNSADLEYARSRLTPRNRPSVINVAADRIRLSTNGTRRAGSLGAEWLARSWGPSMGFEFEGQFEGTPGLRRREIYSASPGVEFYDGTFVRSLELGATVKRDLSRDPPNTQWGPRARLQFSREVGPKGAQLQGEISARYFVLTRRDRGQDLRFEGRGLVKLQIPLWRHFTIAPFLDVFGFALKTRPLWGYNMMTGVTIGFSRIWKPQYERFL